MDLINYRRRDCREVVIGGKVRMGAGAPVVIQSMTSTSSMDTEASVAQIRRIAGAGAEIVRLTAQGTREAENIGRMRAMVDVPLVADIHFNPAAAMAAAAVVDKVRINPGNFCRPGAGIEESLLPLLGLCREKGTALRIGVNHGSLSSRIMERFGDTPEGMVESAMEFLRVCARHDFHAVHGHERSVEIGAEHFSVHPVQGAPEAAHPGEYPLLGDAVGRLDVQPVVAHRAQQEARHDAACVFEYLFHGNSD